MFFKQMFNEKTFGKISPKVFYIGQLKFRKELNFSVHIPIFEIIVDVF